MAEMPRKNVISEINTNPKAFDRGSESQVHDADVTVLGKKRKKSLAGKFIKKVPTASFLEYRNFINKTDNSLDKEHEQAVLEWYEKFKHLKKINAGQKPGEHRFNLPGTVKLLRETDGSAYLLISNLKDEDPENFIDLKNADSYCFSPEDKKLIQNQILADIVLAQKFGINLSFNNNAYPLDTWVFLKKERKVYIADVADRVVLNSTRDDLHTTTTIVQAALKNLRTASQTSHSPRYFAENIGE